MQPPIAEKQPHKISINGTEIIDNYDWLRDRNWPNVTDPKIISYLEAENEYSANYFTKNESFKNKIFEELKSRIKLADTSVFIKRQNYYYYTRTEADKDYPIYCRKNGSLEAEEEIILDVNELAKEQKFTRISSFSISPSQKLLAYSVDYTGNEEYTIFVKDLASGKLLSEKIDKTIDSVVWHEDESGFFYTPTSENWRKEKIMFHRLGSITDTDKLIMHESNNLYRLSVSKSSSKKYIFIESGGHDSSEVYYFSMDDKDYKPVKLITRKEKIFYNIDHANGYFYIHTNDKGSNFRLVRLSDATPAEDHFEEYIAHDEERYLNSFDVTQDYLLANYKNNGLPEIYVLRTTDKDIQPISFPEEAFTASAYSTNYEENDIRVNYSSLKRPDTIYRYHYESTKLSILKQQEIPSGFNPDQYEVKRLWADNNGVKIPVTVFYKQSLFKGDGSNPLYLYGYGSYGYAVPPSFRSTAVSLANRGFVYAIAHIRGGDDLGFKWYEDAKFLTKKNTFEDFIECAEFLIEGKYTSKGLITIMGGSAGGMLVGYAVNNAPDLFKAAVAHVPFVDVINTMLDESLPLTPGEFKEWGNPKDKEYFDYMMSYSPYDNVGKHAYPNMFITAGLSDPRVTYWEAAKWVAKLRDNKDDDNLLLLKVNMTAGHAGASGRFDALKEVAEEYAFIFPLYGIKK